MLWRITCFNTNLVAGVACLPPWRLTKITWGQDWAWPQRDHSALSLRLHDHWIFSPADVVSPNPLKFYPSIQSYPVLERIQTPCLAVWTFVPHHHHTRPGDVILCMCGGKVPDPPALTLPPLSIHGWGRRYRRCWVSAQSRNWDTHNYPQEEKRGRGSCAISCSSQLSRSGSAINDEQRVLLVFPPWLVSVRYNKYMFLHGHVEMDLGICTCIWRPTPRAGSQEGVISATSHTTWPSANDWSRSLRGNFQIEH